MTVSAVSCEPPGSAPKGNMLVENEAPRRERTVFFIRGYFCHRSTRLFGGAYMQATVCVALELQKTGRGGRDALCRGHEVVTNSSRARTRLEVMRVPLQWPR